MADKKITQFDSYPTAAAITADTYFVLASGTDSGGENYKIPFTTASLRVLDQAGGAYGPTVSGDAFNIDFGANSPTDISRDVNFRIGGVKKIILTKEGEVYVDENLTASGILSGATGTFGESLTISGQPVLTGSAGLWSTGVTSSDIYYDLGNVGCGTTDPAWPLQIIENNQGSGIAINRLISPTTLGTHIAATGITADSADFADSLTLSGAPVSTGIPWYNQQVPNVGLVAVYRTGNVAIGFNPYEADGSSSYMLDISGGAPYVRIVGGAPTLKLHPVISPDVPGSSSFSLWNNAGSSFQLTEHIYKDGVINSTHHPLIYTTGENAGDIPAIHCGNFALGMAETVNDAPSGTLRVHGSGVFDSLYAQGTDTNYTRIPVWTTPPSNMTDPGSPGEVAYDVSGPYLYVCLATDTWRRITLDTW